MNIDTAQRIVFIKGAGQGKPLIILLDCLPNASGKIRANITDYITMPSKAEEMEMDFPLLYEVTSLTPPPSGPLFSAVKAQKNGIYVLLRERRCAE